MRDNYRNNSLSQQAQDASSPLPSLDLTHIDSRFSTYSQNSSRNLLYHPNTNPASSLDDSGATSQGAWFSDPFKGWKRLLLGSWLNLLLIVVPVAWILSLNRFKSSLPGFAFVFCIIALIPLVKMHETATRELSRRIGGSKAGLVNASLSNMAEIVVAVIALRKCELRVVQSSLIGSILSKLLLIMGLCFFAGGMRSSEQIFDITQNQINSSLLTVSVGVLVFPAAFHFALGGSMDSKIPRWQQSDILQMSRGVSVVLIFIYLLYLSFQLGSHSHLYRDFKEKKRRISVAAENFRMRGLRRSLHPWRGKFAEDAPTKSTSQYLSSDAESLRYSLPHTRVTRTPSGIPPAGITPEVSSPKTVYDHLDFRNQVDAPPAISQKYNLHQTEDVYLHFSKTDLEKVSSNSLHQEPEISWLLIGISLTFLTVAVGFTVDSLVESMDDISKTLNKTWIALILLPAVSSIAECSTAIGASFKDQLALSINVAVGSSIQTAFFVIPLMINIAWMMGKPLSLLFDPFEALILYISVQTMSHVVGDGKSNWLEGAILIFLFVIIAICLWFYPGSSLPSSLSTCT